MSAVDALLFWDHAERECTATGPVPLTSGASNPDAADAMHWALATDSPRGVTLGVVARRVAPGVLAVTVTPSHPAEVGAVGARLPAAPGERFYGLGERFGALDLSGRVLDTWAADQAGRHGQGPTSYAPTPFLLSSRGYGLLLDTTARATFDLRTEGQGGYCVRVEESELRVYLIAGPHPQTVLKRHARLVGLPPLPPRWTFGVWKNLIGGQARVEQDVARLRQDGIPVSAIWIYDAVDDRANVGWPWQVYGPTPPGPYPDLPGLIARLHGQGLKVLGYLHPFVYPGTASHADAERLGLLVRDARNQTYVEGWDMAPRCYIDFTNPRAVTWWQARVRFALTGLGFDGAMLDFGEEAPVAARYANGEPGALVHNRYPVLYHRAAHEAGQAAKPGDAVFFARAGYSGSQPYTTGRFTGDQARSWDRQTGLPAALAAMLSGGLSGWPYWGPDIAGFYQDGAAGEAASPRACARRLRAEKELWIRWVQLGALAPTMRDMDGAMRDPVGLWTDDETRAVFRAYARLHAALAPYLYRCAAVAHRRGLPLVRPLFLNYPGDATAWRVEDQYLVGDDLLVAPVLQPGRRARRLYLPAGTWRAHWTAREYTGPGWATVPAPLRQIPLFLRVRPAEEDAAGPRTRPRRRYPGYGGGHSGGRLTRRVAS